MWSEKRVESDAQKQDVVEEIPSKVPTTGSWEFAEHRRNN